MLFIETSLFTKLLSDYLGDEDYRGLQNHLLKFPESGSIVRGSGGVRKVRWAALGRGKSGGVRVIYYWKKSDSEIWMLTIYGKSEQSTIAGHQLKKLQRQSTMANRDLGAEILAGIEEIQCFKEGKKQLKATELSQPSEAGVIRAKLNMSQAAFAAMMGVSKRTLQDWEQGRRKPNGPATALLRIAEQHPEVFMDLR